MVIKCIDVSKWQGPIDWRRVRGAGVESVMIRAAHWLGEDERFRAYMEGAQAAGLDVGVYHYSCASNVAEVLREAEFLLRLIAPYRLTMPVALDFEDPKAQGGLSAEQCAEIVRAYLGKIEAAGYYGILYATASWLNTKLSGPELDRFDKWVAHHGAAKPNYDKPYGLWQYGILGSGKNATHPGSIPGIGTDVDVNHVYKDYPAIIRAAGLNGWGAPSAPTDGPQEGANLADLLASEREMRVAAESDRDAWKTKYYDLLAAHNVLKAEDNLLRQGVAELARKWPVK